MASWLDGMASRPRSTSFLPLRASRVVGVRIPFIDNSKEVAEAMKGLWFRASGFGFRIDNSKEVAEAMKDEGGGGL